VKYKEPKVAWHLAIAITIALSSSFAWAEDIQNQQEKLIYEEAETSQISGSSWNRVLPNSKTFDAIHRSVLLRFPGAARKIKDRLDKGFRIAAAGIELSYNGYETHPEGYLVRDGLGGKKWEQDPPRWHIIMWPLRRPWRADANLGPTFGASIKGVVSWTEPGAMSETSDRFPVQLGPSELSHSSPIAHVDITRYLASDDQRLGEGLRLIEESGFIIQKVEKYDSKYRDLGDAYEWAVPTGGHGLTFSGPKLIVRFLPTDPSEREASPIILPPPTDFEKLASNAQRIPDNSDGSSSDIGIEPLREKAKALLNHRPEWMTEWQFTRAQELLSIGGDASTQWLIALANGESKAYRTSLDETWRTPPRYWKGWGIQDDLLLMYQLNPFVPDHIRKHLYRYWESWLMPDIATDQLFHPQSKEADTYAKTSGDWRGRASFFRAGYNYVGSTQNFNHTAAMGALLGGKLINSKAAMADGRNGLENLLLRYWAFTDGSSQEMLDHYYLSITLSGQKMLADYGPTAFDRLAGRIMLERTMEMLATLYHPRLHRFVGASGRARLSGVLVEQDGIYGAVHVLSSKGVLNHLDKPFNAKIQGMPVWGYDFSPGRVGLQSLSGPWAPKWFSRIIDDKTFPFEELSAESIRGNFKPPLWRSAYLGAYYGLASQNIKGGTIDVLAQWTRSEQPSRSIEGLGTMTVRYCINGCDMATTNGGIMPVTGGITTFQHKNQAIIFTRPLTDREALEKASGPEGLKSLGTAVALWNFQPFRTWRIFVDGHIMLESDLPLHLKSGQILTIADGPSYIGIRTLPPTDLGRGDEELVVAIGGYGGKSEPNGASIEPALTITSYNLKSEAPLAYSQLNWERATKESFGGFIIELGDETEYRDFTEFNKHFNLSVLETEQIKSDHAVRIRFRSGDQELTASFATDVPQMNVHFPIPPGLQERAMQNPLVNGRFPFLQAGLERNTTWSQQGVTGHLEKNGVVLETDPGRKSYLIADRQALGVLAYNPLPDPANWQLAFPDGASITANGKVGLLRVAVDREANTIEIDHAARDLRQVAELAKSMTLKGFPKETEIRVNGVQATPLLPVPEDSAITVEITAATAE